MGECPVWSEHFVQTYVSRRCVAAVEMALHLCHLSVNTTPNQLKFTQSICLHT